jgi:hypothetical protein
VAGLSTYIDPAIGSLMLMLCTSPVVVNCSRRVRPSLSR